MISLHVPAQLAWLLSLVVATHDAARLKDDSNAVFVLHVVANMTRGLRLELAPRRIGP